MIKRVNPIGIWKGTKQFTANDLENILVRMRLKDSEGLNMWKRWKLPSR